MMLEFVCIILPGVFFAYAAEALMNRQLTRHGFGFLAVTNVLLMNAAVLAFRNYFADFLTDDTYALALGSLDATTALMKQLIFSGVIGVPLCLIEAFAGRFLRLRLEDTGKEDSKA